MRTGVDRHSGELLTGWAECAQSIEMIVTTAIGELVLGRDFGCNAPALIDRPMSKPSIMDHFVAIAEALRKWEPGYRLQKIGVTQAGGDGVIAFEVTGIFYPLGHLGDYSLAERRSLPVLSAAALGRI